MKSEKPEKQTKRDKVWQEKVEKKIEAEKIELEHPKGKERFERVFKRIGKKS